MNDAFGKVAGFLLAAVLMFVIPVQYAVNSQKATARMYLYTEVEAVCGQVENTGIITEEMYKSLDYIVSTSVKRYSLRINVVDSQGNFTGDEEIKDSLYNNGEYKMNYGDYVRIEVKSGSEIYVYCGGMIKYYEDS